MILSMFRVMVLSLLRDRGALVLAFVLPVAIFVIFAAIFAATASDELPLKVAFGRADSAEAWDRFEKVLRDEPSLQVIATTAGNQADVSRQVERGVADVGLFIKDDPNAHERAPLVVLADPGKSLAGAILVGQIQGLVARRMPDLVLSRTISEIEPLVELTLEQSARLTKVIAQLASENEEAESREVPGLVEIVSVMPLKKADATVTYYAGAVAILFLLFSAMQGAAVLIDERSSGILDRIAVIPRGPEAVVCGKFLFLVMQGVIQASLIFAAAAAFYDVEVINRFWLWLLITIAAAMAVSGLALAVAATCTSRQQAQTISTFIVLVCSAVGGSMVPSFMMPLWLQDLGRFTPNAWVIEAYQDVLWRGEAIPELLPELGFLLALAVFGTLYAVAASKRRLRL
ncbi:ABC transporter permease [Paracoccus sp. MBLB3053]|uniref:ABC transporter permease n=1 Tax=Paracoccus aurantius TaxID=3073814 RepID=A0ABU2HUN7_9RHOB|nr:ABC transporter permease [Paracoccus sp. MBLB3053]MDS9468764.1 ABC transporter permease [Paracoccus sp. MBLB3053]